jgi:hypothetical protein
MGSPFQERGSPRSLVLSVEMHLFAGIIRAQAERARLHEVVPKKD